MRRKGLTLLLSIVLLSLVAAGCNGAVTTPTAGNNPKLLADMVMTNGNGVTDEDNEFAIGYFDHAQNWSATLAGPSGWGNSVSGDWNSSGSSAPVVLTGGFCLYPFAQGPYHLTVTLQDGTTLSADTTVPALPLPHSYQSRASPQPRAGSTSACLHQLPQATRPPYKATTSPIRQASSHHRRPSRSEATTSSSRSPAASVSPPVSRSWWAHG